MTGISILKGNLLDTSLEAAREKCGDETRYVTFAFVHGYGQRRLCGDTAGNGCTRMPVYDQGRL